ncbi:MAG: DUF4336 domain-containing protein [Leptolyngbya sp. SIO4C1]|nr:DUF4336 domain-containing protein [Leptolyngbya sp. SIO4C1]
MSQAKPTRSRDWSWPFWPLLPLYPYGQRRTLQREIVKDTIWTFDQLQGILYVVVPVRMTVVRLEAGGLLVYAPVAPTPECVRMVRALETEHGAVKYIILPTVTAIEHKVFVGPFARKFPSAQVYVTPGQWSFPFNLPLSWLGFPNQRTQGLPIQSSAAPFADEFDYEILGPLELGLGPFSETAMLHKRSQTLLVTDSVVSIPAEPPPIVQLDTYPLLFHAKDSAFDQPADTYENRRKGWQRIALFAFYFRPSALKNPRWGEVLRNAFKTPYRSRRNYFGLFPFDWQPHWQQSFEQLRGNGRLLVAPVLQSLIFNRGPQTVFAWADTVSKWDFQRIIACHLDNPIAATGKGFRQAFEFLCEGKDITEGGHPGGDLPQADFELLKQISVQLKKTGVIPPAQN